LQIGTHGGRERLGCTQCGFVQWSNPIPVVAAIVERNDRVVLVRSHGVPDTWYGLVAGFLETGETPEAAVLREVAEELGLKARLERFVGAYPFELRNQIIFAYHVRVGIEPIALAADELVDYKEVPIERLKPWPLGTGPALRDWLIGRGYTPTVAPIGTPHD
jgi:NADH pyrophosphatase NudC (nudix superfamily)